MDSDSVNTASGTVSGSHDDGVWSFKGVPYGDDTGGSGRFRPAQPPQPWTGVRECVTYGPSCPQMTLEQMTGMALPVEIEGIMGILTKEPSVSEDCLVLNVWTPNLNSEKKLPVLVWLHGGGLNTGSASWPLYDFTNLARNRAVVMVGVNHRLGIFGFLDVSRFGEDYADSGNVGMLDVVAALGWVGQNIEGFGGDPNNVTVFGESGGGAKTSTLLAMPAAQGLMHKAFPMSGALLAAQTPERAQRNTDFVLEDLGIGNDLPKLQAVEADRLVLTEMALQGGGGVLEAGRGRSFGPVLGPSIPEHPEQAIRLGSAADIPVVSGCTTDEMMVFLGGDPELWTLDEDGLRTRIDTFLGDNAQAVLAAYQAARPQDTPTSHLIAITTDAAMRIPHIRLSEAKVQAGGASAWMYSYAWGTPDPTGQVRSGHGSDMPYFFDNVDKASFSVGPQADELMPAMSGALIALARTGDPNHEKIPDWPAYSVEDRATMRFDTPPVIENDPLGAERVCWDGVPLGGLQMEGQDGDSVST